MLDTLCLGAALDLGAPSEVWAAGRDSPLARSLGGTAHAELSRTAFDRQLRLIVADLARPAQADVTGRARDRRMTVPRLREGDRVRLVSPASTPSRDGVARGVELLEGWGLRVEVGRHAFDQLGYLAGDDHDRLDDLNEAFRDPGVRAVLATRGGKGAYRIADSAGRRGGPGRPQAAGRVQRHHLPPSRAPPRRGPGRIPRADAELERRLLRRGLRGGPPPGPDGGRADRGA